MKRGIDHLFNLRNKFAIIGLTGKTGSGCTTAAGILCASEHNISAIDSSLSGDQSKNEKREWDIISKFYSKNWEKKKLHCIRIKDIISTFILEANFEEAQRYLEAKFQIDISEFKTNYDIFYEKNKVLNTVLKNISHVLEESNMDERAKINEYIFCTVGDFTDKFKSFLDNSADKKYIKIFQNIGDNIRKTGCAFKETDCHFDLAFCIAQRVNSIIKVVRKHDSDNRCDQSLFILDALRNPLEVYFFKERFSAFYLMAINCSDKERKNRLIDSGLNGIQIKEIDHKESEGKGIFSSYDAYTGQDIKSCIGMADLHINNFDENNFTNLTKILIKYTILIQHPGLIKPTRNEFLMQLAVTAAENSGCLSRNVGAVITDKYFEPLAIGWNCVPQNQVPCNLRTATDLKKSSDVDAYSDFEKNDASFSNAIANCVREMMPLEDRGLSDFFCFKKIYNNITGEKNQVHTRALHAEENTILQCAKHGNHILDGGYLFTSASPCVLCAKKLCQMGISEVFFMDPYPDITENHIFGYKTQPIKMTLFTGATGVAFQKLYTPLLPIKDEIEAILAYSR